MKNTPIDYSKPLGLEIKIPEEVIYADDYDSITDNIFQRTKFNKIVKNILEEDNLLVNETKTEHTTLVRNRRTKTKEIVDEPWRHVTKFRKQNWRH